MIFLELILIALGLAMDSFAVSIANGIQLKNVRLKHALRISLHFGIFQAVMPIIGWVIGIGLKSLISYIDHWIVFGLLGLIGLHMIYEAFRKKDSNKGTFLLDNKFLIIQSFATSIDAFIVGTSLAFLGFPIISSAIIIGIITFTLSFCGVFIGNRCGTILKNKAEIIGGIILIGIGSKILLEHLLK